MSNRVEQLIKADELGFDALIFQDKSGNGQPNYHSAYAIIRKIRTPGGVQWALHTLMFGRTGSGIYGDINEVLRAAEAQFGVKSEEREWMEVEYADPDFPARLIPM